MSADLLRRAAAMLREHANTAIPGPWVKDGGEIYNTGPGGLWVGETLHSMDPLTTEASSAYVVLMHPPVALALADLLDRYADVAPFAGWGSVNGERLIAVARAVLREPEVTS
jgi:hypothetical protein